MAYEAKKQSGHPRLFDTAEELQLAVDKYFQDPPNKKPIYSAEGKHLYDAPVYTVCGFAYSLGFLDRSSIYEYIKLNDEYSRIIKKAKFFIESNYESLLQSNNVAGCIFALKNMGWKDKFIVDDSEGDHKFDKFKDATDEDLDKIYDDLSS